MEQVHQLTTANLALFAGELVVLGGVLGWRAHDRWRNCRYHGLWEAVRTAVREHIGRGK